MDKSAYQEFAKDKLGFEFNDIDLLVVALTHRSYVNEHKSAHEHNERLEFLGDAVLELVSSDFLFRNYDYPEGVMTALRAALVRTESIGDAGKELGYAPLVRLSRGEKLGSERAHDVILADCFEAVIGAIYLDRGYEAAREFIEKHILVKIETILEEESWRDPKSYVQELAQKIDGQTPVYRTLKEEGPDHDKKFTVGIYVGDTLKGTGVGHSKQEAQTEAAREGVKKYRQQKQNRK
ncbi:MAG: ribonuclease III [Candidatus Saccharibacteria bacterium]|nr:ribonuclease III [Candidatus Saccharibacteria bacterium]